MLASVRNAREADVALAAGVAIIDLKDPVRGALGELDNDAITAIVNRMDGRGRISATIGDVPFSVAAVRPRLEAMAATGVDFIKVGVFGEPTDAGVLRMLHRLSRHGLRIVLVFFAEDRFHESPLEPFAQHGITGVMLDTRCKESGSLRQKLADRRIGSFVRRSRNAGLLCGLAGSIGAEDITALLPMQADYLGFRGALCRESDRTRALDASTVASIQRRLSAPVMQYT